MTEAIPDQFGIRGERAVLFVEHHTLGGARAGGRMVAYATKGVAGE